jgi:hypothetical protein
LRDRAHLTLVFADLPDTCGRGALLEDGDGQRTVMLDYRLGRRDRRGILGHELCHDDTDILYLPDTPPALIEKGEAFVNRVNAERLVPIDELAALVRRIVDVGDPVHAADVCDHFDVPLDVALRAMAALERRWSSTPGDVNASGFEARQPADRWPHDDVVDNAGDDGALLFESHRGPGGE